MDTQADISIIKQSAIKIKSPIDRSNKINIRGITEGTVTTVGTILTDFHTNDYILENKLHIVPDNFDIPVPGIIGRDFLRNFNCKIDFENNVLTIRLNGSLAKIPIHEGPEDDTFIIPARSEVIRKLSHLNIT